MVPFINFKSIRKSILKLVLICSLGLTLPINSFSNPIVVHVITEIYFDSGDWMIEMVFDESFGIYNLDDARLTGLYDTALFLPGFQFEPGEVIYVTQADLQSEFTIDQTGDKVQIHVLYGPYWANLDEIKFGLVQVYYQGVSAPVGEESIALQKLETYNQETYWTVKEIPNTIGSNPFEVSKRAVFSGYVKDQNNEPLDHIMLHYTGNYDLYSILPWIYTDSNGYFHEENMFCKYFLIKFLDDYQFLDDTVISIEPDSANYFEFVLDTLLMGVGEMKPGHANYSITNYPNPFSGSTTFVITSDSKAVGQKGVIKIYSSEGYIVDIIPVQLSQGVQEVRYKLSNDEFSAGVYFYNLEIGHKKMASRKMLITR